MAEQPKRSLVDELGLPNTGRSLRQLPALSVGAMRLVWQAAPKVLVATLVLQVVGGILLAAQVISARYLLSEVLSASKTNSGYHRVVPWLVILAVVFALNALVAVLRVELQRLLAELVSRHSLTRVVEVAGAADLVSFDNPSFHDRLQRAAINASIRPLQMTTGLLSLGTAGISSAAVAITLASLEPLLLLLALAAVVPVTAVSLSLGRALYRFAVEQTPLDRQRNYIQLLLTEKDSAKEVRAYMLAPFLGRQFADLYATRLAALRRVIRSRISRGIAGAGITGAAIGGTLGLLIVFVSDGRMSLASAGAAGAALLLLGTQLQGVASGVGSLYESALFIHDSNAFLESVVPTRRPSADSPAVASPSPLPVAPVSLQGVSFTYPTRDEPTVMDIDMSIEPGQVVALVGENGSGKTTLAKLLAALYRPQMGTITWSGLDIADLPAEMVRPRVAVLFQDFVRFFMSAYANIALGDSLRFDDRDAVRQAATAAAADEFISALPAGYETLLGPQFLGGTDLSGGQWQRVALARAFFRDAEMVILDEPTAALDPKAEAALFESVRQLFEGRAVVLISHRFATVRLADKIFVLDAGRIVESGSHDALMALGGRYAEMFTLQASAFGMATSADGSPARPRAVKRKGAPGVGATRRTSEG